MNFDVVILGHFARDKIILHGQEKEACGGAVYYGGIALARLGFRAAVVTLLAEEDYALLKAFDENGVKVFAHPAPATSGIKNTYLSQNNLNERICEPIAFAGAFRREHIPDLTTEIFHIGPIMAGEVSLELLDYVTAKFSRVSLDLQGFLRVRQGNSLVFMDWAEKTRGLKKIHTIKADSVEAEVITGEKDIVKAARIIAECGPEEVVITHKDGLLVYAKGAVYEAPFTPRTLQGRTGRGDTCISAYLASRLKNTIRESCHFAAAVTSLKLEKDGPLQSK